MTSRIPIALIVIFGAMGLAACNNNTEPADMLEEAGDAVEEGVEEAGDTLEEAGDEIEDATDEAG